MHATTGLETLIAYVLEETGQIPEHGLKSSADIAVRPAVHWV